MREAVEERLIPESPCRKVALPLVPTQERRFLTADEVQRLASAIDRRYRALVLTSSYMGLRWAEAAGLKRENLHLLKKKMLIAGSLERVGNDFRYVEETKTSSSRRLLDVPGPLVEILARHLGEARESEFVYPAPKGGFLRYHSFRKRFWLPAVDKAGLSPLTFHALRHTCVALLIEKGADILFVQRFLGHRDIRTTLNIYGHLFPHRSREVSDALGETMVEAERASSVGFLWDDAPGVVTGLTGTGTETA